MTITTTSQIGAPVNQVLQTVFLKQAQALAPYFQGTMQGELEKHAGSYSLLWQRLDALTPTTTAMTELSGTLSLPTRAATALSRTTVTATVSKYGDHVFLTEEVELIQPTTFRGEWFRNLGIQAGRSLNRLQRNLAEDNLTLIYASGASADGNVTDIINRNVIAQAVNAIERNSAMKFAAMTRGSQIIGSAPVPESFWGIGHVDVMEDIRNLAGFRPVETYANHTATLLGEQGMVGRVRWIATEEATVDANSGGSVTGTSLRSTAGTSVDLYTSIVFGEQALGSVGFGEKHIKEVYKAGADLPTVVTIFKPVGSAGAGDPFHEISTLAWKAWWAGAVTNSGWGRGIRTGATDLTAV